jgi:hypothetical protein
MIAADLTSVPHNVLYSAFGVIIAAVVAFVTKTAKPVWQFLREKLPEIKDVLLGKTESKASSGTSIAGDNNGYTFNNCVIILPPRDGNPTNQLSRKRDNL